MGKFNRKKAYLPMVTQHPIVYWKSIIIGSESFPRLQFVTWLDIQGRLATVEKLAKWRTQVDKDCVLCETQVEETLHHLLFECTYEISIWGSLLNWMGDSRGVKREEEIAWIASRAKGRAPQVCILKFHFNASIYHI